MTTFQRGFSKGFSRGFFRGGGIAPIVRQPELKARLDTALQASEFLAWTDWGVPKLTGLKDDPRVPAVMVAYGGAQVVGDFRHAAQVVMVYSQSRDKTAFQGIQWAVEDLLCLIEEEVDDAYPRLVPVNVMSDYKLDGSTTYVVAIVTVLDGGT